MLTFTRTKHVGVERPAKDKAIAHGFLDDYTYSMEIDVEFSLPEYEITTIHGRMKRYTTPECPKADDVLQKAVGMRIGPGLSDAVKKQIGRAGCRHYATLLLECCRSVVAASIVFARQDLENEGLPTDDDAVRRRMLEMLPDLRNSCLAYSDESPLMKRISA